MIFQGATTTEEARSFAEASIEELKGLKRLLLEYAAEAGIWRQVETAANNGIPAVADLAVHKNLIPIQNLLAIQQAAEADKLAATHTLSRVERLIAEGRAEQLAETVHQVRDVLLDAGLAKGQALDDHHFNQPLSEALWNDLQDSLAKLYSLNPDLPVRIFQHANWPFPLAGWDQVRATEAKEINALRVKRGLPREVGERWFGVAFSGGGIRSATLNLGILQGLAGFGLLKKVDILSTVSGGGYIGSWLAAWIKRQKIDAVEEELAKSGMLDWGKAAVPPSGPISFLRRFSNYLTPSVGFFSIDAWTVGAVFFRNVALNQVTLAALIGALMLIPRFAVLPLMQPAHSRWVDNWLIVAAILLVAVAVSLISFNLRKVIADPSDDTPKQDDSNWWRSLNLLADLGVQVGCVLFMLTGVTLASTWFWVNIENEALHSINLKQPFWLMAGGFSFVLSLLITIFGGSFKCVRERLRGKKNETGKLLLQGFLLYVAMGISSSVALALLRGYLAILWYFYGMGDSGPWHAVIWSPLLLMMVIGTAAILHVGLLGTYILDVGREWLTRFRAITHLWLFSWSALCCAEIYGPLLFAKLGFWLSGALSLGWLVSTMSALKAGESAMTGKNKDAGAKPGNSPLDMLAKIGPPVFVVGFLLFISLAEHLFLSYPKALAGQVAFTLQNLIQHHWEWLNSDYVLSNADSVWPLATPIALFVILAMTGLILAWRVDINEFSMHHFYKNRLVRCYLGASNRKRDPNPFTGFDTDDDFSFCELKASNGYTGPYHIVNTTLNLSAGTDLAWQERKGASFIFSPAYCGFDLSLETGTAEAKRQQDKLTAKAYRETRKYGYPEGVPLGTAIAISGAAADPNQGYSTSPTVAFLLTVFDVRLGWWLGNPRRNAESALSGPRFGLLSLLSELLGRTDDKTRFVSLSDGGHFDNMGLYELVRRRCRYIILCDGEQDPDYKFEGLGTAIRKCRIDFGAEITIDPRAVIPSPDSRRSEAHCAVGKIQYANGSEGTLLYVKSSLTGDEPKDVLQYASTAATFPHQTTADQWFSESQFESYRALGYAAINAAIEPAKVWTGAAGTTDVDTLFQGLWNCWYPPNPGLKEHATKHTATLSQLLTRVASDEALHDLGHKLFSVHGEFGPGGIHSPEEFYFVMVLLQLVEDIYFDFQLEKTDWTNDPRISGWIRLFHQWANSKIVCDVWSSKKDTFRKDFQNFWETIADGRAMRDKEPPPEQPTWEQYLTKKAGA